jgi:hypothetical protein
VIFGTPLHRADYPKLPEADHVFGTDASLTTALYNRSLFG